MTQMENGARAGKGVHQLPAINYNLGRLCLGHNCLLVEETKKKGPYAACGL